jgi:hypothetical protein
LDCSVQIAGITPGSTTGPINHGNDPEFITYALNGDSEKEFIVIGTEYTGSIQTTGASIYAIKPDSFLASDIPFVRSSGSGFANGGNDMEAFVKWSSVSGVAPFVGSSFRLDPVGGKSSISVFVGAVVGTTDPFLIGSATA